MDGLVNTQSGPFQEYRQSRIMREKWLRVNTGTVPPFDPGDASGFASADPTTLIAPNNGPHFILSPETPDGRPTLGFAFTFVQNAASFLPFSTANVPNPGTASFTVTVWRLLGNLQFPQPQNVANLLPYTAFAPLTGVLYNQEFVTFDVNPCAIRFQIEPVGVGAVNGSVVIAVTEL
jgi:hypothetical protein